MEILNASDKKVEIEYPCNWKYKLIGYEKEAIQKAIHDVIIEREHNLNHSSSSKTGKYVSMNLELLVLNEDDRNFIYEALKKHQNLKMVL
jgi:putative lipoic acid-binding regulatory protein